jgi:hypothetical protein
VQPNSKTAKRDIFYIFPNGGSLAWLRIFRWTSGNERPRPMSEKQCVFIFASAKGPTNGLINGPTNDVPELSNSMSRHKSASTLLRALRVLQNRGRRIGTGTDSIVQQSTATLVQVLTVLYNRALPHWYRHSQYHVTGHCHVGTGTDSITNQCRPVFGRYTTFVLLTFEGITSRLLPTSVYFPAPQVYPLSWSKFYAGWSLAVLYTNK